MIGLFSFCLLAEPHEIIYKLINLLYGKFKEFSESNIARSKFEPALYLFKPTSSCYFNINRALAVLAVCAMFFDTSCGLHHHSVFT